MSLFRKYGESLLGQPIGIEESQVRQQKEGEIKGNMQEHGRYERTARRAYRQSMRDGNFGGAMDALDWIDKKAGGMDPGIMTQGTARNMAERSSGAFTNHGQISPNNLNTQHSGSPADYDQRMGLFGRIQDAAQSGGDVAGFQQEASNLGIDAQHFGFGVDRALQSVSPNTVKASEDSPDLHQRLISYKGANNNLFDRHPDTSVSMINGQPGADVLGAMRARADTPPVSLIDRYAMAKSVYQNGLSGQGSDADHEIAKNNLMDLSRQISRVPAAKVSTQGVYKGSDPTILQRDADAQQAYQSTFSSDGDPDASFKAIQSIYTKANSLDQAKLAVATMRRSKAIMDSTAKSGKAQDSKKSKRS